MKSFILQVILISFFLSCNSNYKDQEQLDTKQSPTLAKPLAPNTCRILGTIVSVDEKLITENPDDPCSKAPCTSVVRIDSVLGRGPGFSSALAKGSEVVIKFSFTLAATRALFPNMTKSFPGLSPGDAFQADVTNSPVQFKQQSGPQFHIDGYQKLN